MEERSAGHQEVQRSQDKLSQCRVLNGSSDRDEVFAKFIQESYTHHVAEREGGREGKECERENENVKKQGTVLGRKRVSRETLGRFGVSSSWVTW